MVAVETWFGQGSGIVVHPDGLVLTAAHVVPGDQAVVVFYDPPERIEARVLLRNPVQDFVVLRLRSPTPVPHPHIAAGALPRQTVLAFGRDDRGALHWSAGEVLIPRIALPIDFAEPRPHDGRYFRDAVVHRAPCFPGDSGGPLVDLQGRLVGIDLIAREGEATVAIPAAPFAPWFDALADGDPVPSLQPTPPPGRQEAVELFLHSLPEPIRTQAQVLPPDVAIPWAWRALLDQSDR